jgi:2-acylglycerol O-acyltransferase 2
MQTGAIALWLSLIPILISLFLLMASYKSTFPFALAYLVYVYLDPAPELGGRKSLWFRELPLWRYMRDYFPTKLVKTNELDPAKNYVFGYHPHGNKFVYVKESFQWARGLTLQQKRQILAEHF